MSKIETKTPLATHVSVTLRKDARPGIVAVGNYAVDRPYTVPVAEAARLVRDKGFSFCLPGDKVACEEALAAAAAAANPTQYEG